MAVYPVMASLFIFAAALTARVPGPMALLLVPLTALAVWSNARSMGRSHLLPAYGLLLALKLGLLLYQVQFRNLPLSGVDWVHYHRFGSELVVATGGDLGVILRSSDWDLFTRITAVTYAVFGTNSQQMYFLVFVTSLVTFTYLHGAAKILLGDGRKATMVAMLFMVWPNEIVLSVTFLREMPIQLLVAASLYHFLRFWRDRRGVQLLIALTLSLLGTLMHSGVIALPIAYAYLAIRAKDRGGLQVVRSALFFLMAVLALRTPLAAPLLAKFGEFADASTLLQPGAAPDPTLADATTYYLSPDMSAVPLFQLPYRIVMFALSPLPWQATNLGTAVSVLIEGLPRLFLVAMLLMAYWRCRTGDPRRDVLLVVLLLTIVATYVVFSLGVSTYGTAMRHRAKIFPLEIILAYAAFIAGRRRGPRLSGAPPSARTFVSGLRTAP